MRLPATLLDLEAFRLGAVQLSSGGVVPQEKFENRFLGNERTVSSQFESALVAAVNDAGCLKGDTHRDFAVFANLVKSALGAVEISKQLGLFAPQGVSL